LGLRSPTVCDSVSDHLYCLDVIVDCVFRYSHGFLFPSEVTRIRKQIVADFEDSKLGRASSGALSRSGFPTAWSFSTVSNFESRSNPELSTTHSVEALVEGSDMSRLREGMFHLFMNPVVIKD